MGKLMYWCPLCVQWSVEMDDPITDPTKPTGYCTNCKIVFRLPLYVNPLAIRKEEKGGPTS